MIHSVTVRGGGGCVGLNSELKNDGLASLLGRAVELGGLLLHWLAGGVASFVPMVSR